MLITENQHTIYHTCIIRMCVLRFCYDFYLFYWFNW